jgi:hypothetical protein
MGGVITIGVDLAKSVFQVHGVDAAGDGGGSPPAAAAPGVVVLREAAVLSGRHGGVRDGASLGREIERLGHRVRLQDAAWFFEDHVVIEDEGGAVTVEREAGKRAAAAFKDVKAAIHRNHGLLTASRHSIDSAAFWFIALERRCQQQLMVEASCVRPVLVPPERARYSRKHVGSDYIG